MVFSENRVPQIIIILTFGVYPIFRLQMLLMVISQPWPRHRISHLRQSGSGALPTQPRSGAAVLPPCCLGSNSGIFTMKHGRFHRTWDQKRDSPTKISPLWCRFHHGDVQQSGILAANMGDCTQRQLTLENAPSNIGIYHIYMGMSTIPEPAVS